MTADSPQPADPSQRASAGSSRDKLLASSAELFHQKGYTHVSLDHILQHSGVCRSNFYYHFKSKEELVLAVVQTWLDDMEREVVGPIVGDDSLGPLAKVRGIVEALIDRLEAMGCKAGCPFGTLANSESDHNERFRAKLMQVFDGFSSLLHTLYAKASAVGELRSDAPSPEQLATATLSIIQGGYLLSKTYTDAAQMRDATSAWFDLVSATSPEPI